MAHPDRAMARQVAMATMTGSMRNRIGRQRAPVVATAASAEMLMNSIVAWLYQVTH